MENNTQPTDIDVGQLEFKHIAKYLPYGLKTIDEETKEVRGVVIKHSTFDWYTVGINYLIDDKCHNVKHIPILRFPDLTKPITHKGETFVPLVELAKIAFPNETDYNIKPDFFCEFSRSIGYNYFSYSNDLKSFVCYYDGIVFEEEVEVPNQELLFEKLAEWMIDTKNLIRDGLAVDVETLDTNPYQ